MPNVTKTAVPRFGDWCSIHVLPFAEGAVPDVEIAHVDPAMVAYARELQARFPFDPDAPTGVAHVIRTGATEFHPDITDDVVDELDVTDEVARHHRRPGASLVDRGAASKAEPHPRRPAVRHVELVAALHVRRCRARPHRCRPHRVQHREPSPLRAATNDRPHTAAQPAAGRRCPTSRRSRWPFAIGRRAKANEVGGDFYDVFPLDPSDHWGIVVGDVCGTGPAAAALTGLARHSIRDSAWHGDSPIEILRSLDRAVRNSGIDSFLTAVYATLDTSGPGTQLTVASGGHPLPIHVRSRWRCRA